MLWSRGTVSHRNSGVRLHEIREQSMKLTAWPFTVKMLVDCVDEIKWNTASFKRLVLPSDYKELILAFVDSHLSQGDGFDDIVQGKGRGIVILLSGVPGVGKTLTAEAGRR